VLVKRQADYFRDAFGFGEGRLDQLFFFVRHVASGVLACPH
jgi:hypothetical protein